MFLPKNVKPPGKKNPPQRLAPTPGREKGEEEAQTTRQPHLSRPAPALGSRMLSRALGSRGPPRRRCGRAQRRPPRPPCRSTAASILRFPLLAFRFSLFFFSGALKQGSIFIWRSFVSSAFGKHKNGGLNEPPKNGCSWSNVHPRLINPPVTNRLIINRGVVFDPIEVVRFPIKPTKHT